MREGATGRSGQARKSRKPGHRQAHHSHIQMAIAAHILDADQGVQSGKERSVWLLQGFLKGFKASPNNS